MTNRPLLGMFATVTFLLSLPGSLMAADEVTVQLQQAGEQGVLRWHAQRQLPVSAMYSEYSLEQSTNLQTWEAAGTPVNGEPGVSYESIGVRLPLDAGAKFYRVVSRTRLAPEQSRLGDAIYGYGTEFNMQLRLLGQLPLDSFVAMFRPTNAYLNQLSFDPATAEFWADFNTDPAVHNATNSEPRYIDFRLTPEELAVFQTNGFVVSERLGTYSFGDAFYKIYTDDLPVFFSCDAALHAWHKSFVAMLEEVEETFLAPYLESMLNGMAAQIPSLAAQSTGTALSDGVRDADYFIAVARSLITGTFVPGSLGQGEQVEDTLVAIASLEAAEVTMFGTNRTVDFSQFKVRGHYDTSPRLRKYFQAMMWCSLVDFRFSGFEFTSIEPVENSIRELSGAVAMHLLLKNSGQFGTWREIDRTLQFLVGPPDSLTFGPLSDLINAAEIDSPADVPNILVLSNLQAQIMSGDLGVQQIQSGYFWSPLDPVQIKLPRAFTVTGQRFVPDGWAMGQCVFDKIIWDENGIPEFEDKVMRRVPSVLDVAFAVLGNDQTVDEIAARISSTNGHSWRDGRPYQHNLAAARRVIDRQNESAWTNSIYGCWLSCLRELSVPTTATNFPEAMRTHPWAMKTLNTQLASWTELKHDTVLYAKQPYTGAILCSYPDGYIEPQPAFWWKMREMALRTKALLDSLHQQGEFEFEPLEAPTSGNEPFVVQLETLSLNRSHFFDSFAATMSTLAVMSQKELGKAAWTTNELAFIRGMMEDQSFEYAGVKNYSGWYPALFYRNARGQHSGAFEPCDENDALVTDVHTDVPAELVGDPGSILHEGVGQVNMLLIVVDCGPTDRAVYAGPVMSHYEFETEINVRLTDPEWQSLSPLPNPPDWTRAYLVPAP